MRIKYKRQQDENMYKKQHTNGDQLMALETDIVQEISKVMATETFKQENNPSKLLENQYFI